MANKQTGSLDLKAAKGAHDDASTKATNFLAIDSTGIMVADLSTNTGITPSTADGRNVFIDSDSVDIRNGQTVLASFGETVTIGDTQKAYIEMTSDTIAGHADTDYFSISSSGGRKQQWAVMSNTAKKRSVGRSSITINIATGTHDYYEDYVDVWATLPNGTRFKVVIYTFYQNTRFIDEEECVKGTESPNYGNFGNAECGYNGIDSIAFYPTLYPQNHNTNGTWRDRQFLLYVYKETNAAFYRFGQDVATEGGHYSFLMGEGTKASYENQLAIGKYNADVSDGVFIIGNGENDNVRSNAFTVNNSGNVTSAGSLKLGGSLALAGHTGDYSTVGSIISKSGGDEYTSDLSTAADTWKALASISLNAGRWIIVARARFDPTSSGAHYSSINISTTSASDMSRDKRYGATTNTNQHSTCIFYNVTSDNTTIYLNGSASAAGKWIRTSASALYLGAMRIV